MKKYRILIISSSDLNIKTNGSTVVLLNYLKYIPENIEISLINIGKEYFHEKIEDIENLEIEEKKLWKFNPFISLSYNRNFRNKKLESLIENKIKYNKYDLIYYHGSIAMMNYLDKKIPAIGNIIDLHSIGSKSYFKTEKNLLKKIFFLKEMLYCPYLERKFISKYKALILVNNKEVEEANLKYKTKKFIDIPIGINIPNKIYENKKIDEEINFIFIGNMGFKPNREGVWNFYNKYLKFLPNNYILNIVGPKSQEVKINDIRLRKVGFIEDLDKFMEKMDFGVATMVNGPGQKNKILDYMSRGIPTFVNSFTNKSNFFDSKYIYVVNNSKELLNKIKELKIIEKEKVRESIKKYSDYNSAEKFWILIKNTIENN